MFCFFSTCDSETTRMSPEEHNRIVNYGRERLNAREVSQRTR
jgi:hypothetical protein